MKWLSVVACLVLLVALVKASPYNKYGRTCKDILCIAGQEECTMEHDACTSYASSACGSYPTCKRKAGAQKKGCASIRCDPGHFCSIRQENCSRPPCEIKPVCIAFRTSASSSSSTSALNRQNYDNNYGQRGSSSYNKGQRGYSNNGQGSSGSYGTTYSGGRTSWSWGSG